MCEGFDVIKGRWANLRRLVSLQVEHSQTLKDHPSPILFAYSYVAGELGEGEYGNVD